MVPSAVDCLFNLTNLLEAMLLFCEQHMSIDKMVMFAWHPDEKELWGHYWDLLITLSAGASVVADACIGATKTVQISSL